MIPTVVLPLLLAFSFVSFTRASAPMRTLDFSHGPLVVDIPLVDPAVPPNLPLRRSPPPRDPAPLTPPADFSPAQRTLLVLAERYYAPMRARGRPHADCRPVLKDQKHHVLCQVPRTSLLAASHAEVQGVADFMRRKYPTDGPEGGLTTTSYYPQPGFAQHGQVRFDDGLHADALFWSLEHGEGCVEAKPDRWCVTLVVQAPDAKDRVRHLVTQPPMSAADAKNLERENLEKFKQERRKEIAEDNRKLEEALAMQDAERDAQLLQEAAAQEDLAGGREDAPEEARPLERRADPGVGPSGELLEAYVEEVPY
jgi:hypothetical protein